MKKVVLVLMVLTILGSALFAEPAETKNRATDHPYSQGMPHRNYWINSPRKPAELR